MQKNIKTKNSFSTLIKPNNVISKRTLIDKYFLDACENILTKLWKNILIEAKKTVDYDIRHIWDISNYKGTEYVTQN